MPIDVVHATDITATDEPAARKSQFSWTRFFAPSMADVLFAAVLLWSFAYGVGWEGLLGDADTGYHIRTGDYVLATGHVPNTDLFSYSKAGTTWFPWEWLAGVVLSLIHSAAQFKGVSFAAGVIIAFSVAILFKLMIYKGAEVFPALLVTFMASGAASIHYLARPHVFSFLFLAVAMFLLEMDRRKPGPRLWLIVPLAAVWANMHGGFAALFSIIGLLGLGSLIEGLVESRGDWRQSFKRGEGPGSEKFNRFRRFTVLGVLSLLATLLNPFTWHLHWHILMFLRNDWFKKWVQEFRSPEFRNEAELQFEILLIAGLMISALMLRSGRYAEALLILFWAHQSLTTVRHITVYTWVVGPIIAVELSRLWQSFASRFGRKSVVGLLRDLSRDFTTPQHTSVWAGVLVVGLWLAPNQAWPKDFPDKIFPVKLVQKYKDRLVPASGPKPKILSSDQIGDYLIYHFYPNVRVFMDGRGDFYGPEHGTEYVRMMGLDHRWRQLMHKWDFDYALLPHDWRLSEMLKFDPEWKLVEDSATGVLFERRRP